MKLLDAFNRRKSIRDFRSDPVSKDTIKKILEAAIQAPSGVNCQTWEFFVLSGAVLQQIKEANIKSLHERMMSNDVPRDNLEKGSVYHKRQVDLAQQLFKLMGIPRDDMEKRISWLERGFQFFNAPAAIILLSDKSLPADYPPLDIGAVMYGITLAALEFGLGTCIEDQGKIFPEHLHTIAGIPKSKTIHTTIAIGLPNWDFPANQVESKRESVDNLTIWKGF